MPVGVIVGVLVIVVVFVAVEVGGVPVGVGCRHVAYLSVSVFMPLPLLYHPTLQTSPVESAATA